MRSSVPRACSYLWATHVAVGTERPSLISQAAESLILASGSSSLCRCWPCGGQMAHQSQAQNSVSCEPPGPQPQGSICGLFCLSLVWFGGHICQGSELVQPRGLTQASGYKAQPAPAL